MSILPKTRDEWVGLLLFPFKAWVLIGYPLYFMFRSYVAQHGMDGTRTLGQLVIGCYMLSVVALLIGALVQSIVCARGAATRTVMYVVGSVILVFCVYRF